MESVSSRGGDPVVKPSMEVWHFQIAVYFAFGFFFLRLVLDRYVFQVSHYFFEFMTEAFIASLVLNSPCWWCIMRWQLNFFNHHLILSLTKEQFCWLLVDLLVSHFVFNLCQRIALWLLSTGSAPIKLNDAATRAKIVKCKESLWKLLYYAACDFFVLQVIYHEPWARDIKLYFHGWPNQELKWVFTFASCLEFLGLELCP